MPRITAAFLCTRVKRFTIQMQTTFSGAGIRYLHDMCRQGHLAEETEPTSGVTTAQNTTHNDD